MYDFVKNFCSWIKCDCFQIILAIITLIVTIRIPIRVMKYQRYQNLVSIYMSFEFAHAIQCLIQFFADDCNYDVEQIPTKYKERFKKEVQDVKQSTDSGKKDFNDILHYQRRYLQNFFMEVEMCRESSWTLNRRIKKDWTSIEAWIVKILIYMDKAVENDPEMYKDISCIKHERMPKTKGMSEYLEKFYNAMRSEPSWVRM